MDTKEIIDKLNDKTDNKYCFTLKDAVLDAKNETLNIELFYSDGVILSFHQRNEAEDFLKSQFPKEFNYNFKFVKNFITKDTILPKISEFFLSNLPSVSYNVSSANKVLDGFKIGIDIQDKMYDYFIKKDGQKLLSEYLSKNFRLPFEIVVFDDTKVEEVIDEEVVFMDVSSKDDRFINITDVQAFLGEVIENKPEYIKDVLGSEKQDVCVCGKIKFFKEFTYERKSKKQENAVGKNDGGEEPNLEQKEPNLKVYYKWQLEGFTGSINCIYFTTKLTKELMPQLKNGDEIVVIGDLEKSKFGDSFSLKIKRISRCKRPDTFEEKIDWKTENKNYINVFPEPVEITKQVDLFGFMEEVIPEYLKNKNIVVFDFETTGLSVSDGAKIIEFGAVKIIDGKIKEKFSCLVNPLEHIPEETTKVHGITDNDVKDSHTIDEVMPDFYKFTRGCYLAGHNVNFDYGFLSKYGKDCKYNFDNELIDTLSLAMQNIKGARNYKLKTLCDKLGINLDNAHRAVHDSMATAELLIKIAELL